jgi:hypothetical protein
MQFETSFTQFLPLLVYPSISMRFGSKMAQIWHKGWRKLALVFYGYSLITLK